MDDCERVPVSVIVHTRNEEGQIRECLLTVLGWASEVIVCDMQSSDETVEIAQKLGAAILQVPIMDQFDAARNVSASHASEQWVLYLDADERLTSEVKKTIGHLIREATDDVSAFNLPFRTISFGTWIEHAGGWWPSYKSPPLLRKGAFTFSGRVHEPAEIKGKTRKIAPRCSADAIEHYSHRDLAHYFAKLNHYTSLETLKEPTSEGSWEVAAMRFGETFAWYYDRTAGYKDGKAGFFLALGSAMYEAVSSLKKMEKSESASVPSSSFQFLELACRAASEVERSRPIANLPALPSGIEVTHGHGRSSVYSATAGYVFDLNWQSEHIAESQIRSVTHSGALQIFGGGEVQLVESIRALEEFGIGSNIGVGCLPPGEGLVHVYSLHVPEVTETLLRSRVPYVLSPIYWDRSELTWITPRLCGAVELSTTLDEAISAFDALQAEANARRLNGEFVSNLPSNVVELIAGASAVLPNAKREAEALIASAQCKPKLIEVIPNATQAQSHSAILPDLPDHPFVACVGRIEPNKNQLGLILACQRAGLPLVLVGSEPHPAYSSLCRRLAGPMTHFLGLQTPAVVAGILENAAVHCLPSFGETPGIANLEACQAGCALVCSDRGAEVEYFGDRATYCNPLDVIALADQLLIAVERDRDHSFEVPHWPDVARELARVYRDVMENHPN